MKKQSRRNFLSIASLAGMGLVTETSKLRGKDAFHIIRRKSAYDANDQINLALIGAGGMGVLDTITALMHDGVKLVAVCDLYDGRLAAAKERWGNDIMTTRDYREVLDRDDIDAVIIATPDHWHKDLSVAALSRGKAVYCEKPMVHSVDEGAEVIAAQKKSGKAFVVGSQGLSSLGNEKARQLLTDGAIGDLVYAEGFWARMSPQGAWQYPIPDDASPSTVDWDTFLHDKKKLPFDKTRFFRWRNYTDYGTGMSGDLFVHLFSSLHFITGSHGPNKIYSSGGLRYWKDGREVPDVLLGTFDYPDTAQHGGFNLSLRCNFVDGTSGTTYLRLVGTEGSMDVKWEEVDVYRNKNVAETDPFLARQGTTKAQPSRKRMLDPESLTYKAEKGYKGAHYDHFANWFHSIRTGAPLVEDATFGFRAAAPALLCNDSYREDRAILWDPEMMKRKS